MRKNVSGQFIAFQMNSTAAGAPVISGTPVVYITIDGGTQATGGGASVHEGNGQWSYAPFQAETNGDHIVFTMSLSAAISQAVNVYPVSFDPTNNTTLGVANLDAAISSRNSVTPPTVAELSARTLVAANYGTNAKQDTILADIANVDSKVSNIGAGGTGAVNHEMVADNTGAAIKGVSFVGIQTGTFVNTESNPVTYHEINDTGNNIDIVYRTTIGGAHQAVDILFQGYLNGGNDECVVQLYDFVGATWDAVYTISGQNGSSNIVEPAMRALAKHTGTGADLGDVLVRFTCTAQSNPTLFVAVLLASAVSTSASVGYSLGALWYDDSASNAGTTAFVDGVADNPVSTWAAIVSLVGSVGLKKVHVAAGSTVALSGNADEYYLFGANWSLNLNGQSIEGAAFDGASSVVGVGIATATAPVFHECQFGNCTVPPSSQVDCGYAGLLTLGSAGSLFIIAGHSEVGGLSAPSIDMNGLGSASTLNVRSWSGGISVIGITVSVVASLEIENGGTVDINGTGGSVFVRGRVSSVVDSSGGAVTIDQSVVVNNVSIRLEMDANSTQLALILSRIGAFTGSGINNILGFFRSLLRSDIATDPTDIGGTFDSSTDSVESIRDRGDGGWTTGGGGSVTDILNIMPLIPNSLDLADTATVRIALMLTNAVDDLPTVAEITPGTISIDRKPVGGTGWVSILIDVVCLESTGVIYFDEVFDSASGYAEGDSIRVIFKAQKITVSANDYEITDALGRYFYTSIRQSSLGGGDWNPTEKENFRSALGIDGIKTPASGGQLQGVDSGVAGIQSDLDNGSDGLGAIKGGVDAIPTVSAPSAASVRAEIDANSTQFALILGRIGAFTGSGVNTILGFFRSLMRSDIATDPTDIGGSFDSTTDSAEAARNNLDTKIPTNLTFTGANVHVTLDGERVVLANVTHTGAVIPVVSVLTGHVPQSGDTFAALPPNFSDLSIQITTGLISIADKTGFRLSAAGVNDILRTAMTESYAAKGSPPTLEQFMSMILSLLADYGVSGTTITARRLDGVSTAMTFTTDDATTPTDRTRTT